MIMFVIFYNVSLFVGVGDRSVYMSVHVCVCVCVCVMDKMFSISDNLHVLSCCPFKMTLTFLSTRGQLAGRRDVFEVLHPYVSDTSVVMQQRMAVLELLEKVRTLPCYSPMSVSHQSFITKNGDLKTGKR